jgi:hypothetical protein
LILFYLSIEIIQIPFWGPTTPCRHGVRLAPMTFAESIAAG